MASHSEPALPSKAAEQWDQRVRALVLADIERFYARTLKPSELPVVREAALAQLGEPMYRFVTTVGCDEPNGSTLTIGELIEIGEALGIDVTPLTV